MLKGVLVVILVLGVLAGLAVFAIGFFQRRLQYFPTHKDSKGEGAAEFEPFLSPDGRFLGYWRPADEPRQTMIFFHGNGGEAIDRAWLGDLLGLDQTIILAEYPGYGACPGSPTEAGIFEQAERIYEEAKRRWNVPVAVLGESLGSAVAVFLASRREISRVALIAPLSSAVDVGSLHYPPFLVRTFLRDKFDAESYARSVKAPLKIIHGTMDTVVPLELGRKLFEAYAGKDKEFIEILGFGHPNMVGAVLDSPFADSFRDFLSLTR